MSGRSHSEVPGPALAGRAGPWLAAAGAGLLYAAAFPPIGAWWLAWVALAPFMLLCARATPGRAAGLGLVWSLVVGMGVAGWLPATVARFFETPLWVGWLAWLGIVLLGASYYVIFAVWLSWANRRGLARPGIVALAWGAADWARASLLIPIPWALTGGSQAESVWVRQLADVAGVFGIGVLVAWVNATVAAAFIDRLRPQRPRAHAGLVAATVVVAIGFGALRLGHDFGRGEPFEVALVQGPALGRSPALAKPEARSDRLASLLARTRGALEREPRLVLWPELAFEKSLREPSPERHTLAAFTQASGAELLVGAPDVRTRLNVREATNSAWLIREGRPVGRYDKVRLVPFSEHNPLRGWIDVGRDRYRPGSGARALASHVARIGVLLCSDAMYTRQARASVEAGAELLANPSYDAWFAGSAAEDYALAAVRLRAVETRRTLLRPSTGGDSLVIDAHGRVAGRAPSDAEGVLHAPVRASRHQTIYQRVGDGPALAAIGIVAFASGLHLVTGRRGRTFEE